MTRDLRSAVLVPNSFFIDLPTIDDRCRKNLFFLTTSSSSKTPGDLRAVGYFLVAEKNLPESYQCYRFTSPRQEIIQALQDQKLYELFAEASPNNSICSKLIASHLQEWKIKPAWIVHGKIFKDPPRTSDHHPVSPGLIEINITTDDHVISKTSKEPLKTRTFSTVVALSPDH